MWVPFAGGAAFLFGTAMDTLSSVTTVFGTSGTLKIAIARIERDICTLKRMTKAYVHDTVIEFECKILQHC